MKKHLNKRVLKSLLYIILGVFLGWLIFHSSGKTTNKETTELQAQIEKADESTIWTCAMHPQIRMHEPGKCPICGMDLIPLSQAGTASTETDPAAVILTKEAAELANVSTIIAGRQKPLKDIRLYGKVTADERLLQNQVAHISGRIEKLLVSFTGEAVRSGQTLATIYSPEMATAEQELIEAAKIKNVQPQIYEAARDRLRSWKITDEQISDIENSGNVKTSIDIVSNTSGIVTAKNVNTGDYVSQGTVLFQVADLSKVWLMFDAYESDLPFLKGGDKLNFTLQALPGQVFSGNISFIDPVIDPVTRVARVRVETPNRSGQFKPEMFATGMIETGITGSQNEIVIPKSSVLWTGERSIVYVKQPGTEPVFSMREIELGPEVSQGYIVKGGLSEGEEIVSQGTFSVDAAAQLAGKPSMMNPEGGTTSSMPGMIMPGDVNGDNSRNF